MKSYYNIFVATENGLLKGINSHTKTFNNLNNLDNLDKEKEIVCMTWTNQSKQDEICFATRDQRLVKFKTDHTIVGPFEDLGQLDVGEGLIKGLEFITENKFVTCVESGSLKLWSITKDENNNSVITNENEFNAGDNISCMKASKFNEESSEKFLVATGGKENDLKIWDMKNLSNTKKEPLFKAKNLPDNWVQLRQPVWVMSIDFLDAHRVAVGTAHNQIRVYDLASGMRKPIINILFGTDPVIKSNYPVTSLVALSNNRVIAGNTTGNLQMFDVGKGNAIKDTTSKCIKKYKGFQGTIKSIQSASLNHTIVLKNKNKTEITKEIDCVASCGLDRYIRVHNITTSELISKVYLKSRLNCLLFSRHEPIKVNSGKKDTLDEDQESTISHSELGTDLGTDELWSDMEQVVEDHPNLKRKAEAERLDEFDSEVSENENQNDPEEPEFKMPKSISTNKKVKNLIK